MKAMIEDRKLVSEVKRYYQRKNSLEHEMALCRFDRYAREWTLQQRMSKEATRVALSDADKATMAEYERGLQQNREKYETVLARHKELVSSNVRLKLANYKRRAQLKQPLPTIEQPPAHYINGIVAEPDDTHVDGAPRVDAHVVHHTYGPEWSLNLFDNQCDFRQWVRVPFPRLFDSFFDVRTFSFIFQEGIHEGDDGTIRIKAFAHGNGGYLVRRDSWWLPIPPPPVWTHMAMVARVDFAQQTPLGDWQAYPGDEKEIFNEFESTVGVSATNRPWTGYLPEDIELDHGHARPIYSGHPFCISVHFTVFTSTGCGGELHLDANLNVPMISGEIFTNG